MSKSREEFCRGIVSHRCCLTIILKETNFGYEIGDKVARLNHLLFMDDLKLFAKTEDQIDSLIDTVHTFSKYRNGV